MAKATNKELFTVNGRISSIKTAEGFNRNTFLPYSQNYLRDRLNSLKIGDKISCTFSKHVAMRSQQQLAYHMILMKYLADYSGTSQMEMHDAVMRLKFGTKEIKIGNIVLSVRKSLSNEAKMPKYDVVELIEFDLSLLNQLEIKVPSRQELGYDDYN